MTIAESLLPEFDREMGLTRRLLERVPDGQFAWKPHEKSMTLGRLAEHLAELPGWAKVSILDAGIDMSVSRPPDYVPPATRAAVLAMFDKNVDRSADGADRPHRRRADGAVDVEGAGQGNLHDAESDRAARLRDESPHSSPRPDDGVPPAADVPLPSIYGPSADEQM